METDSAYVRRIRSESIGGDGVAAAAGIAGVVVVVGWVKWVPVAFVVDVPTGVLYGKGTPALRFLCCLGCCCDCCCVGCVGCVG